MRRFFLKLFRRRRLARDIETELAFHREMTSEHQNPIELGNTHRIREQAFDLWRFQFAENLWRDALYAVRSLLASPALVVGALVSLGVGIGANTAIFQLLNAVRFKTLPLQNPQELAEVTIAGGHHGMGMNPNQYPELTRPIWDELRTHQAAFSGMFAWSSNQIVVGKGNQMRYVKAIFVSGDFFRVLGIQPWRGRLISKDDEGFCPSDVAVVSYSFWQSALGGGPLGRTWVSPDGDIVGVTPPNFFGLSVGDSFDIALPLCRVKEQQRDLFDIAVMGRLRPGWTIRRAAEQLQSISGDIFDATVPRDTNPQAQEFYKRFKLTAVPAAHGLSQLREQYDSSLWLLLAISGLVLVIACANLASLLLARASTRGREMAVRLALGASAGRLVQQVFVEAAMLAVLGAGLGIALAPALSRVLVWALSTTNNEVSLAISLDWRVVLFTAAISGAACLLFGMAPARHALNAQPNNALRGAGRGLTANRQRFVALRSLVMAQIAISFTLLVAALLFVASFRKLMTLDPGMRESNITTAYIAFDDAHVSPDRYIEFQREILEEVKAVPGVIHAASTTLVPLVGGGWQHDVQIGSLVGPSKFTWVSPGYFDTMGITLLSGRDLQATDTRTSMHVAVVNKAFVSRYLGNRDPIGQTMRTVVEPHYPSTIYQIVGVIPDTKYHGLWNDTPPMAFAPAQQYPDPSPFEILMIHSKIPSRELISAIDRELTRKHPAIVITGGDFQSAIRDGMVQQRLLATLAGFFGLVAALLAAIGLYGVVSYFIASRKNEFGVRLAIGASQRQIISTVLMEVGGLAVTGTAFGVLLALLTGRSATSLLFGVTPYDPIVLVSASALLIAVALLASFLPAWRAAQADPLIAMRCE